MGLMRVLKHFNLINCLLIAVSILFAYGFLFPRLNADVTYVVPPLIKKPAEKSLDETLKTQTLSPQEYRAIADENIFHPDRIIPPEKKPESVLPKPEFVLYGTLIAPDLQMAYLEDKKAPVNTPGRGKRQSALKVGESLSGFRVKEIQVDKVVMSRGEETIQVLLQEPGSAKTRESTPGPAPGPGSPGPSAGTPAASGPAFPQPGIPRPLGSGPGSIPTTGRRPGFPAPGGPSRESPLPPGTRPAPAGRIPGFPSPGIQPGQPTPN